LPSGPPSLKLDREVLLLGIGGLGGDEEGEEVHFQLRSRRGASKKEGSSVEEVVGWVFRELVPSTPLDLYIVQVHFSAIRETRDKKPVGMVHHHA